MHSPLEQFTIKTIIPFELEGYKLDFTNSSLFMVLALLTIFIMLGVSVRRASLIPSRLQVFGEMFYEVIDNMILSTSGAGGKRFMPFIFTLFMFILTTNLLGMLPFSFTVTSHIIVTFAMAIVVFLGITLIGFIKHGMHFLSLFLPKGTPVFLAPLMILIELFAYLARPISLSLRLAANMTAGHIVMKVIASFVILCGVFGVVPFALLTIIVGFEIFIAILQAYIFTILACVYLSDAIKLH